MIICEIFFIVLVTADFIDDFNRAKFEAFAARRLRSLFLWDVGRH